MEDGQFKRLLAELGYSYPGYRRVRKGVKKRIRRHMRALGCRDLSAYLDRLAASRPVREACIRRMAVPISRFMRDRAFWDILRAEWLPELCRSFGLHLMVWSAGCACGEEAYSLAISAHEVMAEQSPEPALRMDILATDLNPVCLAKARAGIYPASSLREVPADMIDRYFRPLRRHRRYRVRADLGALISWRRCKIETSLAQQSYHLILMRNNVLTYLDEPLQKQVLARVLTCLPPGGLLVTGKKETLPSGWAGLVALSRRLPYVYRKTSEP